MKGMPIQSMCITIFDLALLLIMRRDLGLRSGVNLIRLRLLIGHLYMIYFNPEDSYARVGKTTSSGEAKIGTLFLTITKIGIKKIHSSDE